MLGTQCSVAQLSVGNASIVLILYVSFDALADVLSGDGVRSTLGVVFTVCVVGAAEVGAAVISITLVARVAHAEKLAGRGVDTTRVEAAGAAGPGAFDALVSVTFVTVWADTTAYICTICVLCERAHRIWWTVGIRFTSICNKIFFDNF